MCCFCHQLLSFFIFWEPKKNKDLLEVEQKAPSHTNFVSNLSTTPQKKNSQDWPVIHLEILQILNKQVSKLVNSLPLILDQSFRYTSAKIIVESLGALF